MHHFGERWTAGRAPRSAVMLIATAWLAGCAAPKPFEREVLPPPAAQAPVADTAGPAIARSAQSLIGSPYRYGGAGPDTFDCSGLVSYVHGQLGLLTPRTAAQQFAAAAPVPLADLKPGDLVFFDLGGRGVSHVGVYVGDGRFVHAPQSGGRVREAELDEEFFRGRFAGAGRFYPPAAHLVPGATH